VRQPASAQAVRRLTVAVVAGSLLISGTSVAAAGGGFSDVRADDPHADAIAWLAANGLTDGCAEGEFCAGEGATRGQIATFLQRLAEGQVVDAASVAGLEAEDLRGQDGAPGATGPQGDPGPEGAPGTEGSVGPIGPAGPWGPMGVQGEPGLTGPRGDAGQDGVPGLVGPLGPQGPTGTPGVAGPQGETGAAGPQGETGAAGAAGPAGATGATGAAGPAGPPGSVGPQGETGATGAEGAGGATGAVGPAGPQGSTGPQGAVGPAGPVGPEGPQGSPGSSGAAIFEARLASSGTIQPDAVSAQFGVICPTGHVMTTYTWEPLTAERIVPVQAYTNVGHTGVWLQFLNLDVVAGSVSVRANCLRVDG